MKLRSTSVYDISNRDVFSTPTSFRTRRATAYKYPATEMNKSISTYSVGANKKGEPNFVHEYKVCDNMKVCFNMKQ